MISLKLRSYHYGHGVVLFSGLLVKLCKKASDYYFFFERERESWRGLGRGRGKEREKD